MTETVESSISGELIQWPTKIVDIDELKPYERNPRKISREKYRRLKRKIQRLGFNSPIVATHDLRIIGGHQRIKILKELGAKQVTVSYAPYEMTLAQFKEALIENNISEGEWDVDMLEEDFEEYELEEYGVDGATIKTIKALSPVPADSQPNLDEKPMITCPKCSHEFTA